MTQQFRTTAPRTVAPRSTAPQSAPQPQARPAAATAPDPGQPLVPHHVSYADAVKMMCLTDYKLNPNFTGDFGPQEAGRMKAPYQETEVLNAPENATPAEIRALHKAVQIRNRAARTIDAPFLSMSVQQVRHAAALALNGQSVPTGSIEDLFDAVTSDLYGTVSLQGYVVANGTVVRRFFVSVEHKVETGISKPPAFSLVHTTQGKKLKKAHKIGYQYIRQYACMSISDYVRVEKPAQQFFVRPIDKNLKLARKQLWTQLVETQPGEVLVIVARPEKRRYATRAEQYEHMQSCVHVLKVAEPVSFDA